MEERRQGLLTLAMVAALGFGLAMPAWSTPPGWSHQVLRSPHFEVIYRDDQKPLAKRYALAAEQARELLLPIFGEAPDKTIVILQDDTDLSNGSANFLPYPHIRVFPVLPDTHESLDEYSDWALEMMVHEYTHILNMYPAHGFYAPFKYLFGTVLRPNAVLPRWYLEGLAVDLESTLTPGGRLRSTSTAAAARALTLDNGFAAEDIARINENGIPTWPYGARPYLYGGWWWQTVQREKGAQVMGTWNQNFSRRLPFLLNGPMREQTGQSAEDIFTSTRERLENTARGQLDTLRSSGAGLGNPISEDSGEQQVFALSPSGNRLVYWSGRPGEGSSVRLKERQATGEDFRKLPVQTLFSSSGTLQVRWLDEDRILFDQVDSTAPYLTYRDLYIYDIPSRKTERLTRGARAQEASPSPDGKSVVFVQNDGGRNHVSLMDLTSREPKTVLTGSFGHRLSSPTFLNERQLLVIVKDGTGAEQVKAYDLGSKALSDWRPGLKASQNLRLTPGGPLVTDATTGVRNVYRLGERGPEPLSNTLTEIESADFDGQRQELIVSELTSRGRHLHAITVNGPARPPQIAPSDLPPAPRPDTTKVGVRQESYQPLAYLWPRFWIPFVYQVEGGALLQGLTFNEDPVGRNSYSLLGSYDTVTRKGSYGASFSNQSLPTELTASYANSHSYLGASSTVVQSQSASLTGTQYWPFNTRRATWSFGGIWVDTESLFRRMGPMAGLKYSRLKGALASWHGFQISVNHAEFLRQKGYLHYGRTFVHMTNTLDLGGNHKIVFQQRAGLAPKLRYTLSPLLGDRNVGGNYLVSLVNSEFLLRGYPSGEFVGRKVLSGNLEYALPPRRLDRGMGTFPWFFQSLELIAFADAMAVEGYAWDAALKGYVPRNLRQFYMGSGGEVRLNTSAGYHLPLSLTLGLYYGFDRRFGGGFSTFLGIGMGALSGLQDKTP